MIKEMRLELGLTQQQVADKVGISVRQYQRIEKNEEATKFSTYKKIVSAFVSSGDEKWGAN